MKAFEVTIIQSGFFSKGYFKGGAIIFYFSCGKGKEKPAMEKNKHRALYVNDIGCSDKKSSFLKTLI